MPVDARKPPHLAGAVRIGGVRGDRAVRDRMEALQGAPGLARALGVAGALAPRSPCLTGRTVPIEARRIERRSGIERCMAQSAGAGRLCHRHRNRRPIAGAVPIEADQSAERIRRTKARGVRVCWRAAVAVAWSRIDRQHQGSRVPVGLSVAGIKRCARCLGSAPCGRWRGRCMC